MRVVITGGTGLIGRALAASLGAEGHEVIVLSRSPGRATALPAGVRAEHWDGRSAAGWVRVADGADAIVNLAGENIAEGRWTAQRKQRIRESRLNAGRAVVEAVGQATRKPRVVVQASAVGYYGPRGDEGITEETGPGSDFLAQVAVDWEDSTRAVEAQGVRRSIARSAVVLATEGGSLPRMLRPFKLFVGGPLGSGRQWFPWIHIEDEVGALRFLLENEGATGPFNLAAPNPVTNAEFTQALGRVLGRPAFMRAPALALRLIFGEVASVLVEGQRAVPRRLLDLGFAFRFPEAEAALRNILG